MDNYSRGLDEFKALLEKEKRLVRIYRRQMRGMAAGKLMISNAVAGPVYYRVVMWEGGAYSRKRVTGNTRAIYMLAHKRFMEERLRRKEHNIALYEKIAGKLLPDDPPSVMAGLPKGFSDLNYDMVVDPSAVGIAWPNPSRNPEVKAEPASLSVNDMSPEEWASAPYRENTIDLQNKTHRSSRGLLCRSKGEALLLDVADNLGYRYRYDCVILIDGFEISPDLVIIRADGKLIFVEHHGWIDGSNGDSAFLRKLWLYSKAGIIQGQNLIVTFDKPDGSTDTELIRRQLQNMMEV